MMKIILNISLLFFIGVLSGCRKDENEPEDDMLNSGVITFRFEIESSAKTRLSTDAAFKGLFENGDQVGIYAVRHAPGVSAPLLSAGNYIDNMKLTYDAGENKWKPESPLYYASVQLDFYAYYPYDATLSDPNALFFSVSTDQSTALNYTHSDLMSGNSINSDKTTPVYLTFKHKLSLVQVEIAPAFVDPNEPLTATLLNCKTESTFDMDSNTNPEGTGSIKSINMFRVEQPSDFNYRTSYTFRAIVPSQTVASGVRLCLLGQNGVFYNSVALSSDLMLHMAAVRRYTVNQPFIVYTTPVAKGVFRMGSPVDEIGRGDDEAQHQVTFTRNVMMSKYPITFEQYDYFCEQTGKTKPDDNGWGRGLRPAINVSWEDARDFCDWLSTKTDQVWRLPTEAQWEYACRAGSTTPYAFGAGNIEDYLWYAANAENKTQEAGAKLPNTLGLYDMHGNVWEWCRDYYDEYAVGPSTDPETITPSLNPLYPGHVVLRGGDWSSISSSCRSASRGHELSTTGNNRFGFRVVLIN